MLKKILLTISYDGTDFHGWQKQKNPEVRTAQQELENALEKLLGMKTECTGSSRTDAGVHALGQRCTFETDSRIPAEKFPPALNSFLPEDIIVVNGVEVPYDFHCRYDTVEKTYEYKIYNNKYKNPKYRNFSEFVYKDLDLEKMKNACRFFTGEHDFKAFCSAKTQAKSTIRTIFSLDINNQNDFIIILVTGNGFLYNMVRIIAGTLIDVGLGRMKPEDVQASIEKKDRAFAGQTAGAGGLTLLNIKYENI